MKASAGVLRQIKTAWEEKRAYRGLGQTQNVAVLNVQAVLEHMEKHAIFIW